MVVEMAAELLTWTTTHRRWLSSDCMQAIERLGVRNHRQAQRPRVVQLAGGRAASGLCA